MLLSIRKVRYCCININIGEDNEESEDSDEGEDWNVNNSGRGSSESFKSENISEEDK